MKITDSWTIAGYTVLSFSDVDPADWFIDGKAVKIDGVVYPRVTAYDLGPVIAIKGEFDFIGKDVEILY